MRGADLQTLFQLGTAANLGYGALLYFSEPIKDRVSGLLEIIETALIEEIPKPSKTIERELQIFDLIKEHLGIKQDIAAIEQNYKILDGFRIRLVLCALSFVSFCGLMLCSGEAQADLYFHFFTVAVLVNAAPMIAAFSYCSQFAQYRYKVEPRLATHTSRVKLVKLSAGQPSVPNSFSARVVRK